MDSPTAPPVRRSRAPFAAIAALLAIGGGAHRAGAQVALPTGFRDSVVATSLNLPTSLAFTPDGRLLFVEQTTGRIRLIVGGALSATDPVGTVDSVNVNGNERGLLGIAVDPAWPTRPYVYVHCTHGGGNTIRISRYELQGDLAGTGAGALTVVAGSRRDILAGIPDATSIHNGGTLRFGPDGMLYASVGEDGSRCLAQDVTSWHGVIFRLDVSGVPAGGGPAPALATITPSDNPFVANADPKARLIWAFGLRNPFRFHIDPADGALFIADVGQDTWEEVDWAVGGGHDYGWPEFEGYASYDAACPSAIAPTFPIHTYDHNLGSVVISAGPYRLASASAVAFPVEYLSDYFFSDYYTGGLYRLTRNGSAWAIAPPVAGQPDAGTWGTGFGAVSDWMVGPDGMLWYCRQYSGGASTGQIGAIAAGGSSPPPPPPPTPSGVALERPYPQPSVGSVTLEYSHALLGRVSLEIYDVRGRLVRTVLSGRVESAGPHTARWDGVDDAGRKAPSGLYVARLEAPGGKRAQRIVLTR